MVNTKNIVEIKNLCKSFSEVKAVNDLSFSIRQGELFSFLGINGAGKSTTISIISGTLDKDSGKVYVCGYDIDTDVKDIYSKIGVVFQNSVLDSVLTVKENLKVRASLYGYSLPEIEQRINMLSKKLGFEDILDRTVGKLSGGQRRRIDVARALINDPMLLILDEPTTGLDPQTRKTLWQVINQYRQEKSMTVLLTTHYMEEASESDYVVIIDSGKIVAEGTPHELKTKYASDCIYIYGKSEEDVKKLNQKYQKFHNFFKIYTKDTSSAKKLITAMPDMFDDFEVTKGKMDDVFLNVTGKKLSGDEQ